jgi:urease accessory protein
VPAPTREAQRRDPRWWKPRHLPEALRQVGYDAPTQAYTVGQLDLGFSVAAGATRPVRHFHRTPLYVLQPIYLDEARPGMAFVYMQQQGDGYLQGAGTGWTSTWGSTPRSTSPPRERRRSTAWTADTRPNSPT